MGVLINLILSVFDVESDRDLFTRSIGNVHKMKVYDLSPAKFAEKVDCEGKRCRKDMTHISAIKHRQFNYHVYEEFIA